MHSSDKINQASLSLINSQESKSSKAFKFNPFDQEFRRNPYSTYQHFRDFEPVHRSFMGMWIVTRYADAKAVLRDPRFRCDNLPQRLKEKNPYFQHQGKDINSLVQATSKWLLYLEPPDHTRLRGLVSKTFSAGIGRTYAAPSPGNCR